VSSIVINGNSNKLIFNRINYSNTSKVNNGQFNIISAEEELNNSSQPQNLSSSRINFGATQGNVENLTRNSQNQRTGVPNLS
jgi:hypothetical protein